MIGSMRYRAVDCKMKSRRWQARKCWENHIFEFSDPTAYDSGKDQYAHAAGIMVLTPQGRIARYFFGIEFSLRDLRLALVEAAANTIGSPVDQLLLFCYHYDPATGKYGAAVMRLVRIAGVSTVLGFLSFLTVTLRREKAATLRQAQGRPEQRRGTRGRRPIS
jgi:hypothetical protein